MDQKEILLNHGSGGRLSRELFTSIFQKHFSNPILDTLTDSAIAEYPGKNLAFTTDSYVVDPIFFPGGNIGTLAVCGTINDLSVSGATPLMLSAGFIIEEGFPVKSLETIVADMAMVAKDAGVDVVTGDTKVIDRGKCDKIFVNTSGIGTLPDENRHISFGTNISVGDKIIINGTVGDHGMAIVSVRNQIKLQTGIESDCASLNTLISGALAISSKIKFMRDATRGGLATVLCECAEKRDFGIDIDESAIPVRESVAGMCEMIGFDPLYIANEGKAVIIVAPEDADKVLDQMKKHELGKSAAIIGEVVDDHHGRVTLQTEIGGKRIVEIPAGDQLPRIC
jgi:hydrogenase expression/formation protein HypE